MIDFGRPSHGLIADPVVDREITAQVPLVTRKELRFPIAKAAPRITNPRREAGGDTHPKVRDRVPAEIVAKINHTALAAGFVTVDLAPDEFPAKTPCVLAANLEFWRGTRPAPDRKSTRLNSSHLVISYAVFCLKKKK